MSSLDQLISRVIDSVYPSTKQLEKRLSSGKKLRIYNGIDPTSPHIHIAKKILDFEKNPPEITYNSRWWKKTNLNEFFEILSRSTVSQLIERDMFQERIKKGLPIATSEFLYPMLQGFDSVALDVDLEIGATDQTFNIIKTMNEPPVFLKNQPHEGAEHERKN